MAIPPRLKTGDEIRVLALSRTLTGAMQLSGLTEEDVQFAVRRLESLGLKVSFGSCVRECNAHLTAAPQRRLDDLHAAIADPSVKAILAVVGGVGAIQMLDGIHYDLIAAHPKIICGYSDITNPSTAIFTRTGLVTYYGPHFTTFMMRQGFDYSLNGFRECLFSSAPFELRPAERWSDDAWHKDQEKRTFLPNEGPWVIQEGEAEGTILGGAYNCLNLLQGSRYFPPLRDALLFLECPAQGKVTLIDLDNGLRALSFQPGFAGVRAVVIGRYARNGLVTREKLTAMIREIPTLKGLPVIANCDFGHIAPIATFPIGGKCKLQAKGDKATIVITEH